MKGTFNQGWWNCFESFAIELLSIDKTHENTCLRVLKEAGISKHEAAAWLDKPVQRDPKVESVVRTHWLKTV